MVDVAFGLFVAALDATHPCDHFLECVKLIGCLAGMRIAGGSFARDDVGNIDIMRGSELHGIFATGNLVIVKAKFSSHAQKCLVGQIGNGAMIGVVVYRPLGEYHIRLLGLDQAMELFVVGLVNNGPGVNLSRERRTCFEDFAGFRGFSHTGGAGINR